MKIWLRRLKSLFCRHHMMLAVNWRPDEACVYIACEKCDKIFGHFHLPSLGEGQGKANMRMH